MSIKISVITVCYNSDLTIQRTLDSVRIQSYRNFEYIVIDGSSTDSTLDLLHQNSDIVDVLVSEPDLGIYDAMNKGMSLASGDVICILNSDDYFSSPSSLKFVSDLFLQNPQIDVLFCAINFVSKGGISRAYYPPSDVFSSIYSGFMPPHPGMFVRTEIVRSVGFYSLKYKIASDFEYILRILKIDSIRACVSKYCVTSMTPGGVSSSGLTSYFAISKELINIYRYHQVPFSIFKIYFRFMKKIFSLRFFNE